MLKKMLLLTAGVLLVFMTACSKKAVEINVSELAARLKDEVGFKDPMSELEENMFEVIYLIKPEDVVDKKVYISTGATAEEIAVFEAKTEEAARDIKDAMLKRVEEQKEGFENYLPEEMPKLNDPVIVTKDKYVIMCISDNNEKAKEIIG